MKIEPSPMKPSADGYEPLGWYQPEEAVKLLQRFDDEGVYAQVDEAVGNDDALAVWSELGNGFGNASQVLISVKDCCRDQAQQIHRDLFGEYREVEPPPDRVPSNTGES